MTIEMVCPIDSLSLVELEIGGINYGYKSALAGNEYIDINCPEGDNWQLLKRSVCRYRFESAGFYYNCSGALINNTNNDGTPYFLTANHCVSTDEEAESALFYFNYERDDCKGIAPSDFQTQKLSGASLVASAESSDFSLLKLNQVPPPNYKTVYAGWDRTQNERSHVVSINHPEGIDKK
ncbi:MAG: trypsin-like peptidase domain-containing protein [Bacteroidales bacterium]|nr:trypsin-like peptidase domain-containing protein [Bacteroidales bacterium]